MRTTTRRRGESIAGLCGSDLHRRRRRGTCCALIAAATATHSPLSNRTLRWYLRSLTQDLERKEREALGDSADFFAAAVPSASVRLSVAVCSHTPRFSQLTPHRCLIRAWAPRSQGDELDSGNPFGAAPAGGDDVNGQSTDNFASGDFGASGDFASGDFGAPGDLAASGDVAADASGEVAATPAAETTEEVRSAPPHPDAFANGQHP